MPCVTEPSREEILKSEEAYKKSIEAPLENLLCFACRYFDLIDDKRAFGLNPDLKIWWENHEKKDKERGR